MIRLADIEQGCIYRMKDGQIREVVERDGKRLTFRQVSYGANGIPKADRRIPIGKTHVVFDWVFAKSVIEDVTDNWVGPLLGRKPFAFDRNADGKANTRQIKIDALLGQIPRIA